MSLLPRPGDLTVPFKGGPVGLYRDYPKDDVVADQSSDYIDATDGLLFVLSHINSWCFVLTSSGKLGWIYEYDVGPSNIAGAVYHIDRSA